MANAVAHPHMRNRRSIHSRLRWHLQCLFFHVSSRWFPNSLGRPRRAQPFVQPSRSKSCTHDAPLKLVSSDSHFGVQSCVMLAHCTLLLVLFSSFNNALLSTHQDLLRQAADFNRLSKRAPTPTGPQLTGAGSEPPTTCVGCFKNLFRKLRPPRRDRSLPNEPSTGTGAGSLQLERWPTEVAIPPKSLYEACGAPRACRRRRERPALETDSRSCSQHP